MRRQTNGPAWLFGVFGIGALLFGGFAALGLKITLNAIRSDDWPTALRIGPLIFVGSVGCLGVALVAILRGPRKVLLAETNLMPIWWYRGMKVLFFVAACLFITGVIGDAF
jgi:hypothetical protein